MRAKKNHNKRNEKGVEKCTPHDITSVVGELEGLHASLNVPEEAGHHRSW